VTSRKYNPPLKVMPEPKTRLEIVDRLDELQHQRQGAESRLKDWIDIEIKRLQDKLENL
jgi:hypothetical protein